MSKFEVPLFVIACSSRDKGSNINIGDYEYFAAMPMDTFHSSLQQGLGARFGKEPVNNFSPLSYVDQLGLIPCIDSARSIKDNNSLAEAYNFCFRDRATNNPVTIQIPGYEPSLSYTITRSKFLKPSEPQTIDIAVTRTTLVDGVLKPVTTQVRVSFACINGARTPKGTYFLDEKDQNAILNAARIKDNSFFNKLDSYQYQKH